MFKYLATTEQTASWILMRLDVIKRLCDLLVDTDRIKKFVGAELAVGPLRLSGDDQGWILTLWNRDYLSGTGAESWGFIRLKGHDGVASKGSVSQEILERQFNVISLRLKNLLLDTSWFHRVYQNDVHTCTAGRGSIARQLSIGYFERLVHAKSGTQKAILINGPARDFDALVSSCAAEAKQLTELVNTANDHLSSTNRQLLNIGEYSQLRACFSRVDRNDPFPRVTIAVDESKKEEMQFSSYGLTYDEWMTGESSLTNEQRAIVSTLAPKNFPLRIVGPAGSGKTLVMQLLALTHAKVAKHNDTNLRILFITHNTAMALMIKDRFVMLAKNDSFLQSDSKQLIDVVTLSEYGTTTLGLEDLQIIDQDAQQSKAFQLEQVQQALRTTLDEYNVAKKHKEYPIISYINSNDVLFDAISSLILNEISSVIKGHGLMQDEITYTSSENALSRLHGVLNSAERKLVFETCRKYNTYVFEGFEVLDPDDVALSMVGRLRTPIWRLKRKELGYDFIFVDEAQLFNENEKRIFHLLSNGQSNHVPIVLALDKAQDPYGFSSAGIGTLGIDDIENESLPTIHRSTLPIVKLAFFVIHRTTDLFNADFPDFSDFVDTTQSGNDSNANVKLPSLSFCKKDNLNFGRHITREVQKLRRENVRTIAIICHSDKYFDQLNDEITKTQLPLHVLLQRGEMLDPSKPVVVLTKPAYCGGQEFDTVIAVGLEEGVTPPIVPGNEILSAALEQQALREMYLSFTRAKTRILIPINLNCKPSEVISRAVEAGLIATEA